MSVFKRLLDYIFPCRPCCQICGFSLEGNSYICRSCQNKIIGDGQPFCPLCGRYWPQGRVAENIVCEECGNGTPPFIGARSLGPYGGILRDAIYLYKYQGHRSLAEDFGVMLAGLFVRESVLPGATILEPVPLSKEKLEARGFNQSELLARKMSSVLGIPVGSFLSKVRNTASQSKLTREARIDSVRGAFQLNHSPAGQQILLIDDIFTTGATVSECSRILMQGGACKVSVLTLASGMLEKRFRGTLPREEKVGTCRN